MNNPQMLMNQYRNLFQHGDFIKINSMKCRLDMYDDSSNSAPMGLLFVRERTVIDPDLEAERPIGPIIGVINIFNGEYTPGKRSVDELIACIPDDAAIAKLFYTKFPEELVDYKTLFENEKKQVQILENLTTWELLIKLLKKILHIK